MTIPSATPAQTLLTTLGTFATRAVESKAWSFPDRFIGSGKYGVVSRWDTKGKDSDSGVWQNLDSDELLAHGTQLGSLWN